VPPRRAGGEAGDRCKTAVHVPNVAGSSRQAEPTRAITSAPLSAADRSGLTLLPGICGARRSHRRSLEINRCKTSFVSELLNQRCLPDGCLKLERQQASNKTCRTLPVQISAYPQELKFATYLRPQTAVSHRRDRQYMVDPLRGPLTRWARLPRDSRFAIFSVGRGLGYVLSLKNESSLGWLCRA
jgi:hypothetical protein